MTTWQRIRAVVEIVVVGFVLWHAYQDHRDFHTLKSWAVQIESARQVAEKANAPFVK